ncbi:MAG TPA: hypothetical protein VHG10_13315 [Glycomyces sp.]|nr:hypothetical protein [Glycomyces sp.]
MPDFVKVFYLASIALTKGDAAADAATRRISGRYPADMDTTYEPKPLPGFVALRDLDTQRYMPPTATDAEIDEAVGAGDWQRLASMLDKTWQRWDERSYLVYALSTSAVKDDSWLKAWEQSEAGNPGALLVRANRTVRHAWEVRGAKFASQLTGEQIDGFRHYIELAESLMRDAITTAPDDPTPYEGMLRIAMGRSWSHEAMEELWGEYTKRHPHGFEGHLAALQYWCAKWRGSHERARSFAAAAAEGAPAGTFLRVLPLVAAFEEHGLTATKEYRTREMRAAVDACLEEVSSSGDADPHILYQVRHVLAFFLNRAGRHAEAAEQFRIIDGHIKALPWVYFPNTIQEYGWFRRDSVRRQRK